MLLTTSGYLSLIKHAWGWGKLNMKKRILYVEDNPNNRLYIKRILQSEGHEYIEAVDGESAWNIVEKERPDFIFIDLSLPGLDGVELTRILKTDPELGVIPIVALTAHGDSDVEKIARSAGCDGFLLKPADVTDIRNVLQKFLNPSPAC